VPDLVTHTALGYFITRKWPHAALALLFLVGNMLPDLMTRPAYILFPATYWWVYPFHTPLGAVVLCWGAAGLFRKPDRRTVFLVLTAGCMTHFVLDAFQKHAGVGYLWFSPFSWRFTDGGLFWPEDALRWLPLTVGAVALAELFLILRRRLKR
jgi:hypothetical protein